MLKNVTSKYFNEKKKNVAGHEDYANTKGITFNERIETFFVVFLMQQTFEKKCNSSHRQPTTPFMNFETHNGLEYLRM